MRPSRPAVDAEFVLEGNDPDVAQIQEIGGPLIRGQILFFDLEADLAGIIVSAFDIIDGHHKATTGRILRRHAAAEVGGKSGNAALARQIIGHKENLSNIRRCFHDGSGLTIAAQVEPLRTKPTSGYSTNLQGPN